MIFGEIFDVTFGGIFGDIFGVIFGEIFGEIFGRIFGKIFGVIFGDIFGEVFALVAVLKESASTEGKRPRECVISLADNDEHSMGTDHNNHGQIFNSVAIFSRGKHAHLR